MALPMFSPLSIPIKAAGMFSKPFVTCSRLFSLPCRYTRSKSQDKKKHANLLSQSSTKRQIKKILIRLNIVESALQSLTSLCQPISLLRDSGCLCFHLLCMKPSILSSLKIMVRWGYGPKGEMVKDKK